MSLGTLPSAQSSDEENICMFLPCKVVGVEFFACSNKICAISVSYKLENITRIKRVDPKHVFVDFFGGYDFRDIPGGAAGMAFINNSITTSKLKRFER